MIIMPAGRGLELVAISFCTVITNVIGKRRYNVLGEIFGLFFDKERITLNMAGNGFEQTEISAGLYGCFHITLCFC